MTAHKYKFGVWCEKAVSGILFPPDQHQVYQELMNHMYDHYDDLIEQGCDPETAAALVVAAMGDAQKIAPQLAAIHRPFWGYFLRATRVALAALACLLVLTLGHRLWQVEYSQPHQNDFDPFIQASYDDRTLLLYAEPGQTIQSDGYSLTLSRAAAWQFDTYDALFFQVEVFNPLPWAQDGYVPRWFRAVDSLGNTYDCFNESVVNLAPYIAGNSYYTAPFTYTHDMWISDYRSRDAEWIEFYYDRAGRRLSFRLDLTGGGGA